MVVASTRSTGPAVRFTIDVAVIGCHGGRLGVASEDHGGARSRAVTLPWSTPARGELLDDAAARVARKAVGRAPPWMEQVGAFADGAEHPSRAILSVCYVAVCPWVDLVSPGTWLDPRESAHLGERQRRMVTQAVAAVRSRIEQAPIAFSLLPRLFTLAELQLTYETVLGRRLHKASFRRALQAAFLVEPTGECRGEGRGRPAQLFRQSLRRRPRSRRGVRMDLL